LGHVSGRGHILDAASLGDHVDRLYRAAWAMCGSRADAEDLVQETFARVLAQPRHVQGESDRAYLLQALRNTFVSSRRTASRRIVAIDPPPGFEAVDRSGARRPADALEVREVFALIAGLADGFRDALVAVDVVGLSYAEAGTLLGVKEATITSRVYRARLHVARGMERVDPGVMVNES
jgi:RNA polymerase sigma-70 factor (ECF subfamily)